jgi:hypothetical protein
MREVYIDRQPATCSMPDNPNPGEYLIAICFGLQSLELEIGV